jgi:hypothetical protein
MAKLALLVYSCRLKISIFKSAGDRMKRLALLLFMAAFTANALVAESRFNRQVIKVKDPKEYQFFKLDDVHFPALSSTNYQVSCLVYRGTQRYYVEIGIQNKTSEQITLLPDFVTFNKSGYTVFRTDTLDAARQSAQAAGIRFVPTPPPQMPSTTNTTINATATTYGNQTQISGTATTTENQSAQAGANFGNALGNALAARSFYKAQSNEVKFASFLTTFAEAPSGTTMQPGQAKVVVATFEQAKQKKAPFEVVIKVGTETFRFSYKE